MRFVKWVALTSGHRRGVSPVLMLAGTDKARTARTWGALAAATAIILANPVANNASGQEATLRYDFSAECPYELVNEVEGAMTIGGPHESTWRMNFKRILHLSCGAGGDQEQLIVETRSSVGEVVIEEPSSKQAPIRFEFDISAFGMSGKLKLPNREVALDSEALVSLRAMLGVGTRIGIDISGRGVVSAFRALGDAPPTFTEQDQEEIARWICGQLYPPLPENAVPVGGTWTVTPARKDEAPTVQVEETQTAHAFSSRRMAELEEFITRQLESQESTTDAFGSTSGITSAFFWPFDVTYVYTPEPDEAGVVRLTFQASLTQQELKLRRSEEPVFVDLKMDGAVVRDFNAGLLRRSEAASEATFRRGSQENEPFLSFSVKAECRREGIRTSERSGPRP